VAPSFGWYATVTLGLTVTCRCGVGTVNSRSDRDDAGTVKLTPHFLSDVYAHTHCSFTR
jgi:hypothetical protein